MCYCIIFSNNSRLNSFFSFLLLMDLGTRKFILIQFSLYLSTLVKRPIESFMKCYITVSQPSVDEPTEWNIMFTSSLLWVVLRRKLSVLTSSHQSETAIIRLINSYSFYTEELEPLSIFSFVWFWIFSSSQSPKCTSFLSRYLSIVIIRIDDPP